MFIESNAVSTILAHIESLQPTDHEVILILFAETNLPEIEVLIESLNRQKIEFFGGIFPGLIYGNERKTSGCIVKKFKCIIPPFCVTAIANSTLAGLPSVAPFTQEQSTAIVLVDGLTPNIYRFLEKLNDLLGGQCNFIGGGAGSISLLPQPCVFSRLGFVADAAIICVLDTQIRLGVRHGWEQLAGPMVATRTEGNTIFELNWNNAIEVYNAIVEKDCGITLNEQNFQSIAQGYPFGIFREKEDDIVRDPLSIGQDGSIICIGEVQTNTVLHILRGQPAALLEAAQCALVDCSNQTGFPIEAKGTFVVDCITRALFLGEQFTQEMDFIHKNLVINHATQEPFGVLSLGEISSYGDGTLELFNKTVVIGTFH